MFITTKIALCVGVRVAQLRGVVTPMDRLLLQRDVNAQLISVGESLGESGIKLLDEMITAASSLVQSPDIPPRQNKEDRFYDDETIVVKAVKVK